MNKKGIWVFGLGVLISFVVGIVISIDPGYVCQLDADNLPTDLWNYPAMCFITWAFGAPLGFIIAAFGALMISGAEKSSVLKLAAGLIGVYLFVSFGNGPMPHVPWLFGVFGFLIMLFYFLILWKNLETFKDNAYKLAGYTFLVIGFWFTCGLGSRQYQPALGAGESPIDISFYFVLAMLFFWLGERKSRSLN